MSSRASSFSRYYPQILIITGVIVALGVLHLHQVYTSPPKKKPKQLRRRNAQRQRNRLQSFSNTNGTTSAADSHANATAEALLRLDGTVIPDEATTATRPPVVDPISLPDDEAITTMLNNAGVAARGNREDGGESDFSYDRESKDVQENQNVLQLLYLIAEDQAKQQGYVHRGVTCNLCSAMPIRGVRYRCSNCIDFDLCESCEAQDIHPKTHLFYKVRIPAPFLGSPQKTQQPVYPGKPSIMAISIPPDALKRFTKETCFEPPEIEALYEQFKCLAATEFPDDPNGLGGGIDRKTFDKCFVPNNHLRPPPPNLIYDRMFAFFDTDGNKLIGFEEFVKGLSVKTKKPLPTTANMTEKFRRTFRAYDLDDDGYIERKDVLKMFRAYYALQKDLVKDLIAGVEDDMMESTQSQNVIHGSQPLSAAFSAAIPHTDDARLVKTLSEEINDVDRDALNPDGNELGRRSETIANALQRHRRDTSLDRMARRNQRAAERLLRQMRDREQVNSIASTTGNTNGNNTESSGRGPQPIDLSDEPVGNTQSTEHPSASLLLLQRSESAEGIVNTIQQVETARALIQELSRHAENGVIDENLLELSRETRDNFGQIVENMRNANFGDLADGRNVESVEDMINVLNRSTDSMDDMIHDLNRIMEAHDRGEVTVGTVPTTEPPAEETNEDEEPAQEEPQGEEDEQEPEEDHIPDTIIERAATPAPPREEPIEEEGPANASPGSYVIPAPNFEPQFGSSTFDLPDDWTSGLKDPIRRPMKEELKLYYLEDYYKSDDEGSDDDDYGDDFIKRKKPAVSKGLEREEDVGREILCQVVEQGINEMLDALFLAKERDGLEVVLSSSATPGDLLQGQVVEQRERPKPSNDENKENIDKMPSSSLPSVSSSRSDHRDPENPFSVLDDTADATSQNSASTSSLDGRGESSTAAAATAGATPRDPLATVRKEMATRGGPGRISEQEFVTFMHGDMGKRLGFMSAWISMGSF
ncbi:uncharacterized protein DFL_002541 [Arthrobotrys flagrans]|uniref:ZZ-type domain-containing protein n=2 Tax=Arthrobotrys flagrans TaxID=97331 RepID=A0A437AB36_ARTFL|nr:hypothetical protein DFL_002541 [Arthrobotrys flagrans]